MRIEIGDKNFDIEETAMVINTVTGHIYIKDIVQWVDSIGKSGQMHGFHTDVTMATFGLRKRAHGSSCEIPTCEFAGRVEFGSHRLSTL